MKQRYCLLLLIALAYLSANFAFGRWKTTLLFGDSNGYYMHVVSFFVNQDVGDYDQTIRSLRQTDPRTADGRDDPYGIRLTDKGRRYIKYTLGAAVMETPFFLLAHAYATLNPQYEATGWSLPYLFMVSLSTIFYILLGFNWLILILEKYFSKRVTALVVLSIALGTNLFYHATSVTMAHGFLFFDFCLLIYATIRFYEKPNVKKALLLGAVVGLITLTRVPEVVGVLIPILWGITGWESLKNRGTFLWKNYQLLLWAALSFMLVFAIQLVYWYYVSGHLIFNPYQGENFDFLDPHILKGWFHFKNGWLIYTPIMAWSLLGWLLLRSYLPQAQGAVFAVVALIAYVHYSYYVWAYFPGLGSRPMIETYPLLALAMAAAFAFCLKRKWLSWLPVTSLVLFSALNIFQTWQMNKGLIWTERGNAAFYWEALTMTQPTLESLRAFDSAEIQPDSSRLALVSTLVADDFEQDSVAFPRDSSRAHSGHFSLFLTEATSDWNKTVSLEGAQGGDWIRVGIYGYMNAEDQVWDRNQSPDLIVETYDEHHNLQKWNNIKISCHLNGKGKADYSIWYTGVSEVWGEAVFYLHLPRKIHPGWTQRIYVLNQNQMRLYLDDFSIKLYREK